MNQLCRIDTQSSRSTRSSTGSPVDSEVSTRSFEFINLTTSAPPARDLGQRKVVRAHVVKDFSRRRKLQRLQSEKLKGRRIQPLIPSISDHEAHTPEPNPELTFMKYQSCSEKQESPVGDPQYVYDPPSRLHEDLTDNLLFPVPDLRSNPWSNVSELGGPFQLTSDRRPMPSLHDVVDIDSATLPWSTTFDIDSEGANESVFWEPDEEAVHYGKMYLRSTYIDLFSGRTESDKAMRYMAKVLTIVNSRLRDIGSSAGSESVTENLIESVASIATAEALRSNLESWKIHMSGVIHLASSYGSMSALSLDLRHKLYRADLLGVVNFCLPPNFAGTDNPSRLLFRQVSPASDVEGLSSSHSLLSILAMPESLTTALLALYELSTSFSRALASSTTTSEDQRAQFHEQSYSIQYYLLKLWQGPKESSMEECLQVASVLYIHATWQELPLFVVGTTRLLDHLRVLIAQTDFDSDAEEHLLLWLLFIGAISAQKGEARIWFVANIQRALTKLHLDAWVAVHAKLSSLWWVGLVHEKLCKAVYDEAAVLNSVLIGEPGSCILA